MSFLFFIKSTLKHSNFVIKELVNLLKMDLSEQLKKLFPDHQPSEEEKEEILPHELFVQKEPMICKYEKRKGKPTTIISGYEGEDEDFKILAKEIKSKLAVKFIRNANKYFWQKLKM